LREAFFVGHDCATLNLQENESGTQHQKARKKIRRRHQDLRLSTSKEKKMQASSAVRCCFAALGLLSVGFAFAQSGGDAWPSRPVTIVISYPPGGSSDPEYRIYAQKLAENTGQQFVIEHKGGAGTTIGAGYVAKAAPNGLTLLAVNPTVTMLTIAYKDLPFDPTKDLAPVSLTSKRSSMLMVPVSLPINNLKELMAYAKANPGKLNYGTASVGGVTHLAAEWFKAASGADITIVLYKGTGPMTTDLLAGRVHMGMGGVLPMRPFMTSGKLRPIGVSSAERIKVMPDLPTLAEQGVTGYDYTYWSGFMAPGATPRALVDRISVELIKVAKDPAIVKKMEAEGYNMVGSTPDQLRTHIAAESTRWRKVVQDTGIKLEE
jgi:tripartite-type tricarboxylate transporter receptor subunit TctC